jgi:hypothetical protein
MWRRVQKKKVWSRNESYEVPQEPAVQRVLKESKQKVLYIPIRPYGVRALFAFTASRARHLAQMWRYHISNSPQVLCDVTI